MIPELSKCNEIRKHDEKINKARTKMHVAFNQYTVGIKCFKSINWSNANQYDYATKSYNICYHDSKSSSKL